MRNPYTKHDDRACRLSSPGWPRWTGALAMGLLLLQCITGVSRADTYDTTVRQLSIPLLAIGAATYSGVVMTPGGVPCIAGGSPAAGPDSYNVFTRLLSIPVVTVGGTPYANVLVTAGSLVSVASVTGADSYVGGKLTIPAVQLPGGKIYTDVVITVAGVVSAGGGMPGNVIDSYDPATHRLTIAAVQYGSTVFTNAVITPGTILSVGGVAASAPSPPTASNTACSVSPLNLATSALPGSSIAALAIPVGGTGNISIIAENVSGQALSSVSVSATTGTAQLPVSITMCSYPLAESGCTMPPAASLSIPSIAPGTPPDYADSPIILVQVTATGTILSNSANQILITFRSSAGTVIGAVSVPVTAGVPPVGTFVATPSGNGILDVPVGQQGAFAVAAENQGAAALSGVTVVAATSLPITVTLCQTDPETAQCLAPPDTTVSLSPFSSGANVTLAVFVSATTALPDNPAANLLFVNFETATGTVVGSASVEVTTN